MERIINFKRFDNGKPITLKAEDVKRDKASWEFAEIGASLEKADPRVIKAVTTAALQYERKAIKPEEFQAILSQTELGAEMMQQLTAFRALLASKGYEAEGGILLHHSVSNGIDWINCRLYRTLRKTAEESNRDLIAAL